MAVSVTANVIGRRDPGRPGAPVRESASSRPPPIILRNRNDVDFTLVAFEFTTAHCEAADFGWGRVAS